MKHLLLAAPFLALAACATTRAADEGKIQHVVVIWLKEPGDAAARARIVETSHGFRDIPGVLSIRAGEPLASEREVVDDSFDVALVMEFEDEASLAAYDVHPIHARAVSEVLAPLAARVVVYDVVE